MINFPVSCAEPKNEDAGIPQGSGDVAGIGGSLVGLA
jgi:hypothetical protein